MYSSFSIHRADASAPFKYSTKKGYNEPVEGLPNCIENGTFL